MPFPLLKKFNDYLMTIITEVLPLKYHTKQNIQTYVICCHGDDIRHILIFHMYYKSLVDVIYQNL